MTAPAGDVPPGKRPGVRRSAPTTPQPTIGGPEKGPIEGWKLFRLRRNGTLGPLFINTRQQLQVGQSYEAECHPTPGFAVRPGWHVCSERRAPHLTEKGRVWARVRIEGIMRYQRPECQGGLWFTAKRITILEVCSGGTVVSKAETSHRTVPVA